MDTRRGDRTSPDRMRPEFPVERLSNPYDEDKVIAACGLFGAMDTSGARFSGGLVAEAIANMHDRGNGLGGGFAGYGLYPDFRDSYCLHVMFLSKSTRAEVEDY